MLAGTRELHTMNGLTRTFLVLLRLAIGWHFLFEGLEKLQTPGWSSEVYLRESAGPLADEFRGLAGDRLVDRLTPKPIPAGQDPSRVAPHERLPDALERDWQDYFNRFVRFYGVGEDPDQLKQAEMKLLQSKDQTANFLVRGVKTVKRTSPWGPTVEAEKSTPERLQEYQDKLREARQIQDRHLRLFGLHDPDTKSGGPDVIAKLRAAKADANKLRAELLTDLNEQTLLMKRSLYDVLTFEQQKQALESMLTTTRLESDDVKKMLEAPSENVPGKERAAREKARHDLVAAELAENDPVPGVPRPRLQNLRHYWEEVGHNWKTMSQLEKADVVTSWGLTVVGGLLLAGLFTRTACLAGAAFLLLFFLAMPPLPWVPDNPRAEGHYLFINKNIIEMLALLALATTRSGRWLGLDALLQFLNPWRRRGAERAGPPPVRSTPATVRA